MTYSAIYCSLIERRRSNPLPDGEYGEVHHILPKSEGGDNSQENLIRLSAREHYVAHLLLAKIYDDNKMYSAVIYMQTGGCKNRKFKFNSRLYAKLREEYARKMSIVMTGRFSGEKHWNYGRHWSEEDKEKQRLAHKGQRGWNKGIPMSDEAKKKLSINNGSRRPEVRQKLSELARNRPPISDETRKRMSIAHKGNKGRLGQPISEEIKSKISKSVSMAKTGYRWWNNRIMTKQAFESPGEGWTLGRIKKTED